MSKFNRTIDDGKISKTKNKSKVHEIEFEAVSIQAKTLRKHAEAIDDISKNHPLKID